MEEASRSTFRITLWRPWLLALTLLAPLVLLGVVFAVAFGEFAAVRGILLTFIVVAVALLLPIGLVVRTARWHVDPQGIGGRNNSLGYHYLNWSDIESVEPWLLPGYRYLQVNGGSKRWAFWLPLFLTDMPGFRSAVTKYAPPGNPLRVYLEKSK